MAVTKHGDRRKGIGRQSGWRKGNIEKIKFEGERDKEQEVIVRTEAVPPKKASSVWSWYEEFAAAWGESFITKKEKRKPKQGK